MKKYFIFAAVALVALCNVSCSSSDDEPIPVSGGTSSVTLPEPAAAATAAAFDIPETAPVVSTTGETLESVNFTESGKAILSIGTSATGAKYVTFDSKATKLAANKTRYDLKDGTKDAGYIIATAAAAASAPRRAAGDVTLEFFLKDIEITNNDGTTTTVSFTEGTTTNADPLPTPTSSTSLNNICRTWFVDLIDVTLSGDVDCTITQPDGNLLPIARKAQDNDAQLEYDEFKEFCRSVESITLDKTGLFSIEYKNASGRVEYQKTKSSKVEYIECDGKKASEVCSWYWADTSMNVIRLEFRNSDFGNKFLNEDSRIRVDIYGQLTYFSIATKITGNKNYNAIVVFQLRQ
jgi:hypothetical protein